MAQENGLRFKLVYSHFGVSGRHRCPMPNGNHISWVNTLNRLVMERGEEVILGQFRYIAEADSYQKSLSNNLFRHHNFFGYFIKPRNISECLREEEVEASYENDVIYLYPIEIEWSNLRYLAEGVDIKDEHNNFYRYEFTETISPRLIKLAQEGKVKIIFSNIVDPAEPVDYYQTIEKKLEAIGIPTKQIIWIQGNKPRSSFKEDRGSESIYLTSILSLTQGAENFQRYPTRTALGYVSDVIRPSDLDINKRRPKRFLCFNRMINRPHRLAMVYMALKYDLLSDSIWSFVSLPYKENVIQDMQNFWEEPGDDLLFAPRIVDLIPYELDTQHLSNDEKQSFATVDNNRKDFYENTYFHIVSETRLGEEPSCFFSEKTWRPIMNLQPFIHVGGWRALAKLKELGFKTFGHVIDESYDEVLDPVQRFAIIKKEILRLKSMSMEEMHNLYYSVTDILIHNQKLLSESMDFDPLEELKTLR
jgi:hypothetical protein